MKTVFTILTDPLPNTSEYYIEKIKNLIRPILRLIDGKSSLKKIQFGGHYGVTRSLIEGSKTAKINFNYNPQKIDELNDFVIVLSGIKTLKRAIELKKQGRFKFLAAGPNLVILPSDYPQLIGSEFIDCVITNSNWIKDLYALDLPVIERKMIIWPAGVNTEFWKPTQLESKRKKIVFYKKRPVLKLYSECLNITYNLGYEVVEIIYGNYEVDQYKSILDDSCLLIHFVEQESQGLSLLEAWSMNVPTLVWNLNFFNIKNLNVYCSSAPYLTDESGLFFQSEIDFEHQLKRIMNQECNFSPREYAVKNFSDERAALDLYNKLTLFTQN